MIMTRFAALALTLAICCGGCGLDADAQTSTEAEAARRHHFGMDWVGKPEGAINLRLPDKVIDCFDRWHALPDRIEQATSWGTFATGAAAATLTVLVGGALVYIARNRGNQ